MKWTHLRKQKVSPEVVSEWDAYLMDAGVEISAYSVDEFYHFDSGAIKIRTSSGREFVVSEEAREDRIQSKMQELRHFLNNQATWVYLVIGKVASAKLAAMKPDQREKFQRIHNRLEKAKREHEQLLRNIFAHDWTPEKITQRDRLTTEINELHREWRKLLNQEQLVND